MIFPIASIWAGLRRGAVLARSLGQRGWLRRAYASRGQDLWSGQEMPVVALEVKAYGLLPRLRKWLGRLAGGVECYNCDLDLATYYLYARRLLALRLV